MDAFIFKLPQWEGKILFTYDAVSLLILLASMTAGVFICLWGYKYFQTLCLMLAASGFGYLAIGVFNKLPDNMILKMVFFVSVVFLGICISFFAFKILIRLFEKLRLIIFLRKNLYLFSTVIGATVIGTVVYYHIFKDVLTACLLFATFCGIGIVHQRKRKNTQIHFKTYDQLRQMKYPDER